MATDSKSKAHANCNGTRWAQSTAGMTHRQIMAHNRAAGFAPKLEIQRALRFDRLARESRRLIQWGIQNGLLTKPGQLPGTAQPTNQQDQ